MPDWVSKLLQEWQIIVAAPVSFALVSLLIIAIVWAIVNWSYSAILSSKNAQIELLNGRLGAYEDKLRGATPEQAAGELARLRAEVEGIKNPPRNPNAVYQNGRPIGMTADAKIDAANGTVAFGQMTVNGVLDEATNIEFRNLVLAFKGADAVGVMQQGLAATATYSNAKFAIVGNRAD